MTTTPALLPELSPLPADAVLLHIGVHKTGTTAIQAAFADARPELAAAGVTYPGRLQAQHRAALVAMDRRWGWNDRGGVAFPHAEYDNVIREVAAAQGRVVLSSEFWCEADAQTARRVVEDLGAERVHVVITLRNIGNLLPSSYQQYLKYGLERSYDDWLTDILTGPGLASPTFWRRHDHGAVVQRWAESVGADRMTVLVLEEVDRSAVFRSFAQLIGIDEAVLVSRMNLTSNRSMTAAEAGMLLEVNRAVRSRLTWPEYSHFVRRGVALRLVEGRNPSPDEPRLVTPGWALDVAAEAADRSMAAIRSSGVQVVGDLGALGGRVMGGAASGGSGPEPVGIPIGAAALAVVATIDAALSQAQEPIPSKTLARTLARRIVTKVTQTVRRALRR